ncbi:MAG TPA: hypothetical protein VGP17_05695 [Solirubrobacteraceae bacterium]|nr:hypothetical protein [Solirubrobacteraceae bacterium]
MLVNLVLKLTRRHTPEPDRPATLRPLPVRPSPMVGELHGKRDVK